MATPVRDATTLVPPRMAVHRRGSGPDVVLFHGGMGSWKHWVRNVEALATRFTVHEVEVRRTRGLARDGRRGAV